MEYILVIGFSLLILLPVTYFMYDQFDESRKEVYADHLLELAREIAFTSEELYYQGFPSKTTIDATIPPNVHSILIESHYDESVFLESVVLFVLKDSGISIYATSSVPLQGGIATFSGAHKIRLEVIDPFGAHNPSDDKVKISDVE